MKKLLIVIGVVALILVGSKVWSDSLVNDGAPPVSTNGLHWHPQIQIYIKGEKQTIPQDIGIGTQYSMRPTYSPQMRMTAIHTHDDVPIIHLEFEGRVTMKDIELGNFFEVWGKEFGKDQLFDRKSGANGKVLMFVNGIENFEFEKYHMQDGDEIEIRYE